MPKFKFICKYCNHMFEEYLYTDSDVEDLQCPKCNDKNLKHFNMEERDVFGYLSDKPKKDAYIKKEKDK